MFKAQPSPLENSSDSTPWHLPKVLLTRRGIMYLGVNFILLLTAINYSNHNILLVALFLLSLFIVSLVLGVRRFLGVKISVGEVSPVFLGQKAQLPLEISQNHHGEICPVEIKTYLASGETQVQEAVLAESESTSQLCGLTPIKRGRYCINKVEIGTKYPFGLFYIFKSQATSRFFWIYPKPLKEAAMGTTSADCENPSGEDIDDSLTLRPYQVGDPIRRIHKRSLMGQSVLVKEVQNQKTNHQWLMWDQLLNLSSEKRLQMLAGQVLDADWRGKLYGLSLPNGKVSPAVGDAHKHKCLRMLAEY